MPRLRAIMICLLLCLLVLSQIVAVHNKQRQEAAGSRLLGHTTAQQAIELSRPVFAELLPQQGDLFLKAEPSEMLGRDYRPHRYWNIECIDSQGVVKAHLSRDADSGAIILVGCLNHPAHLPRQEAQESAAVATEKARTWLAAMGYPADWRSVEPPKRGDRVWRIVLRTGDQEALLSIDSEHGSLLSASIRPI